MMSPASRCARSGPGLQIQAPIERVWEEIYHAERWPAWWKHMTGVDELEPGAADGGWRWMNLLAPAARLVFSWNHDELMREGARAWPPPRRGPGAARHARTAAPAGQERAMGRRGRRADNTAPVCLVT